MPCLFEIHLAALALREPTRSLSPLLIVATLALHLLGLAAFWRILHQPIWLALPMLTALLAPLAISARVRRRPFAITALAPLFFLYTMLAARFVYVRGLDGRVPGYFDNVPPDPRAAVFFVEPIAVAAFMYTLVVVIREIAGRTRVAFALALLLGVAACAWAGAAYVGHRTRGVTASDPYAYAQMGVDLATRGTPLHRFTLFPSIASLQIAWTPVIHAGYRLPGNLNGDAATDWPIGGAFPLALAYCLIGEEGLYLVNPLMSLLMLATTGLLAWELFRERDRPGRTWIVALSLALLATSQTVVFWATVPMVDAQAALFSTLAIYFALRWRRPLATSQTLAALSGAALGLAYFVRHTQVLLAPAIVVLLWLNDAPRAARGRAIVIAGIATLLVALPDLWYHQWAFGGAFDVESTELRLFSLATIAPTWSQLLERFLAAYEFGWLVPFFLYGVYRLAREKQREFFALALWVLGLLVFHLPYPALRLRDLLPEFPPLIIATAFGMVALITALLRGERNWQRLAAAFGIFIGILLPIWRGWNIIPMPFGAPQPSFGYLTAAQRAAFDQMAHLTPPRAVIGSTLNDGAIDLYAKRETVRPALWTTGERIVFIAAMFREGRAVFILEDGTEMSSVRRDLASRYVFRRVAVLDVPIFNVVDGTPGILWEIQRSE